MNRSSISRAIEEVSNAVNDHLFKKFVSFDLTPASLVTLRESFYEKYGFPGVVGVIDCTHVAIIAPPKNVYNEMDYFNHKRYHSINVQLVCDANYRILNVNSRYPGATHDSYIFSNSQLRQGLMAVQERSICWLLGDSGYALEPWMMTPIAGDIIQNSPEEKYNKCFLKARNTIERCIGMLKSRWRCLLKHRVLHYTPIKASKIVNTCCVLHNMCIENGVHLQDEETVPFNDLGVVRNYVPLYDVGAVSGRNVRDRIVRYSFA